MLNYLVLFIIMIFTGRCQGHNVVIAASENSFFERCDESKDVINLETKELVQFNLKLEFTDDMETGVVNGNITFLDDFPENALLEFSANVLKWRRGKWEDTVYVMKRKDLCSALFNPLEPWYSLTKNIPKSDRVCPPLKGSVYHLNNLTGSMEISNVHFLIDEGKFKVFSNFKISSYMTCVILIVDVWKN